jgi:hypothetical protein
MASMSVLLGYREAEGRVDWLPVPVRGGVSIFLDRQVLGLAREAGTTSLSADRVVSAVPASATNRTPCEKP